MNQFVTLAIFGIGAFVGYKSGKKSSEIEILELQNKILEYQKTIPVQFMSTEGFRNV